MNYVDINQRIHLRLGIEDPIGRKNDLQIVFKSHDPPLHGISYNILSHAINELCTVNVKIGM